MNFDNIRTYNDSEYLTVIQRLLDEPIFVNIITSYFPEYTEDELLTQLLSFKTIQEFQSNFVCHFIYKVQQKSINRIFFDGLGALENSSPRLLMSNHRDIVLDSALINFGLDKCNLNTCEIAIGSNLLGTLWIKDLVRVNKSFIVQRDLPKQEMLSSSIQLSSYVQHALHEKKQSVWIAQREGRAKDGNDKTNPGVLKMFALSAEINLIDFYKNMNITPVSISYEYDPCDGMKIAELLAKERGEQYIKQDGEDVAHMVAGMTGPKGNVDINFADLINDKIELLRGLTNRNQIIKKIAAIIDDTIHQNYRLWPNNYVAYDMLNESTEFEGEYTSEQKEEFLNYINQKLDSVQLNTADGKRMFFSMYATPVKNKLAVLA